MKNEDLQAITKSIEEKLGVENSALIADDIGKLFTSNTQVFNTLEKRNQEIENLKSTNEKLVIANGNLLQQVPMASEYEKHQSNEEVKEEKKSFNFMSVFDEKGHFKK